MSRGVIIVLVLLLCCMPPPSGILFRTDELATSSVEKLRLRKGELLVELSSYSRYSAPGGGYRLSLGIRITNPIDGKSVNLRPNEIVALYNGTSMRREWIHDFFVMDTLSDGRISCAANFICGLECMGVSSGVQGPASDIDIAIILNDFLVYGGRAVSFDTIYAVERNVRE